MNSFRALSVMSPSPKPPIIAATMADQSITEDSIKAALADRLKAIHVEVQDMSGMDAVFLFPIRALTSWGPGPAMPATCPGSLSRNDGLVRSPWQLN